MKPRREILMNIYRRRASRARRSGDLNTLRAFNEKFERVFKRQRRMGS